MLFLTIDKVLVDFVSKNDDILVGGNFDNALDFLATVYRTGRVARSVQDNHLGPGRHRVFKFVGSDLPLVAFLGLNQHRNTSGQFDHLGIAYPIWRRDDDFITLLNNGENCIETSLLGSGSDTNLARIIVEVVLGFELGREGLTQLGNSRGRSVFGLTFGKSSVSRLLDEIRGVAVGLAAGKSINFFTCSPECLGLVGNGEGQRWGH